MRRVEFIINQIRRMANAKDTNRFSQNDIIDYLNAAQTSLQQLALQANMETPPFETTVLEDIVGETELYDMPSDVFADNSITGVSVSSINDSTSIKHPLDKIDPMERRLSYGYFLLGKQIGLSPRPTRNVTDGMRISYVREVKKLGIRSGTIASYSGTTLTLDAGHESDIGSFHDYFCIVDSEGVQKSSGLPIIAFNNAAHTITTNSGLTVSAGDYVCLGKNSTTHCEIMNAAENFLIAFVVRLIDAVNSSDDIMVSGSFTTEEANAILGLFQDNTGDCIQPPISDFTIMGI